MLEAAGGFDERFVYVHDPYVDEDENQSRVDCVNRPILKREFANMARYGRNRHQPAPLRGPQLPGHPSAEPRGEWLAPSDRETLDAVETLTTSLRTKVVYVGRGETPETWTRKLTLWTYPAWVLDRAAFDAQIQGHVVTHGELLDEQLPDRLQGGGIELGVGARRIVDAVPAVLVASRDADFVGRQPIGVGLTHVLSQIDEHGSRRP